MVEAAHNDKPAPDEIHRRLRDLRDDGQRQWGEINANRARIERVEARLDQIGDTLDKHRSESHEDLQKLSGQIADVLRELGGKADKNGKANGSHGDRLNSLEAWMNRREGAQSLVQWVLARLLPAAAGAATAIAAVYTL